ncbi:MAG: secondary thiamine-phosphate synthase enzyme YjbQ [Wenzhouxiangellaceae bacterium]
MSSDRLVIQTAGRGFYPLTDELAAMVRAAQTRATLCHLFIRHTSASLLITENADPDVLRDLETWIADIVRDGDRRFRHRAEGPDDMSAHVRSVLTATSLAVPVRDGELQLGTWQGVYLWEHRTRPHRREVLVTLL